MSGNLQYFGLSENPFDIAPDSKFFFPSESHKEALASLLYVIKERKGFMLVVGEDGTGKTILINHLIGSLDGNVNVVCFPHGNLSFEQMLKEILTKLQLPLGRIIKGAMLHQLNEYLIQNLARGKNLVLIIDDAHEISKDVMEELRLISNLETSTSKLLQIIFVGQPETETKLNTRGLRQLKQRIGTISRIERLNNEESMAYIDHRLLHAGSNSNSIFSPEALALICKYADGIPRKINILCHNALVKGFGRSEKPIQSLTVREISNEKNLLAYNKTEETSKADEYKPRLTIERGNARLKKSLYFFLAAGCILLALFVGINYLKKAPEAIQPDTSIKPPAVSEKVIIETAVVEEVATQNPVTGIDSVSNIAPVASSESNQPVTSSSEPPDSPKQSDASTKTDTGYKKIVDIVQGATLYSLILNNYDQVNTTLMDLIMVFNPKIANPNLILINSKIRMPEITVINLISKTQDGSYMAHLGTFPTSKEASKYKNLINISDNEIGIIPRKVSPEETWFRVMAGPFKNEEDCLNIIQALRQKGLLPAFGKIPVK